MFCIQPLAVLVGVNGISGNHSSMAHELIKPTVVLHVVNPPAVQDAVCLFDVLKDGGVHPAPFWEGRQGGDSDSQRELAEEKRSEGRNEAGAPDVRQQLPEFAIRLGFRREGYVLERQGPSMYECP